MANRSAYHKAWSIKNKKRRSAYQKEYADKNKDEIATYKKGWYEKNKERILAKIKERWHSDPEYRKEHRIKSKEHYEKNKEKHAAAGKLWRNNNKDKAREISRRYYQNHIEEERQRGRERRLNNKEKDADRGRRWYLSNKERAYERGKAYRESHRELFRVRSRNRKYKKRGAPGNHTAKEWNELCSRYGNRCLSCGKKKSLTEDHIIPVTAGGTSNYISNIQPLCQSCNSIKGNKTIDYRPLWGNKITWYKYIDE